MNEKAFYAYSIMTEETIVPEGLYYLITRLRQAMEIKQSNKPQ